MAQVESCNSNKLALGGEELLTFFREMDNDWLIEPTSKKTLPLVANAPARKIFKKPRRSARVDLINVRQEVAELQLQLQILQEKYEFRESLKAVQSDCGLDWRQFAQHERNLANSVSQVNGRLRKRVEAKHRSIQRIERWIYRQRLEFAPRSLQIDIQIVNHDDPAHVYRALQASLNMRSKGQLEAIVGQCNAVSVGSACKMHMIQWKTFALGDRDVGVKFQESAVIPFASSFIHDVLYRNPVLNAIRVRPDTYVDNVTQESIPAHLFPKKMTSYVGTASKRQLIIRRLVKAGKDAVLLWEDSSCWQPKGSSPPVLVRGSGWALIAPVAGHESDLSVIHSGSFIRIHAMNGLSLKPTDGLVKDVVAHMQLIQQSRLTITEDILMSASRQQEEPKLSTGTS